MRFIAALILTLLSTLGLCQQSSVGIRPQAIVQVQRDTTGASLMRITVLDEDYPPKLLRDQAAAIGKYLGTEARGFQISQRDTQSSQKSGALLRIEFAVDGLIDRQTGLFQIGPIVKALAGAPAPHTINAFLIDFDYLSPPPESLQDFTSAAVEVHRKMVSRSVEYEVTLLSQDPNQIRIPDRVEHQAPAKPPESRTEGPDWIVIITVALSACAAGALVYCLLLNRPSRK